jgi:parallel beta-helix repeat protein
MKMIFYKFCKGWRAIRIVVRILALTILLANSTNAATLTVCPGGCVYSSIQTAINASSNGDTIQVQSGIYYENVLIIKQLTLSGIGMPVVDANGSGSAITLAADGIILEGFTATGGGYRPEAGIKVTSNNNMIRGNIANSNNWEGIDLWSSSNNTLRDNNASNNDYGIWLSSSSNNTLSGNNVNSNNYDGIWLFSSHNNTLRDNNAISNNNEGIWLWSSSDNTLSGNLASNNVYGIYLSSSSNNKIYHNNFINNTNQPYDNVGINSWDSDYPSGGNYWSDYPGVDLKSGPDQNIPGTDGIGDTPLNISGREQDRYPLMKPYGRVITFPPKTATTSLIKGTSGFEIMMTIIALSEVYIFLKRSKQ